MARARLLKPGFFTNAELSEVPPHGRLLFAGLWTLADREGRLKDEPRYIKGQLFPYENVPVDRLLNQLAERKFIIRYEHAEGRFIQIAHFVEHQQPHYKEPPSVIPSPEGHVDSLYVGGPIPKDLRQEIYMRDGFKCVECGSTDRLSIDHIIPQSKGGTHAEANLRTLCIRCNSSKRNRDAALNSTQRQPTEAEAEAETVTVPVPETKTESAPERRNIFVLYDAFMGKPSLTPTMRDLLTEAESEYPPDCIQHCFEEAAASSDGRRSWSYVKAILDRHQTEGCHGRENRQVPVYRGAPGKPSATERAKQRLGVG